MYKVYSAHTFQIVFEILELVFRKFFITGCYQNMISSYIFIKKSFSMKTIRKKFLRYIAEVFLYHILSFVYRYRWAGHYRSDQPALERSTCTDSKYFQNHVWKGKTKACSLLWISILWKYTYFNNNYVVLMLVSKPFINPSFDCSTSW